MKKILSLVCLLTLCGVLKAQQKLIYGFILDQKTTAVIPDGATLSLRDSTGITEPIQKKSNKHNGYFELLVDERFETLIISKDGYETREVSLISKKGSIPRDSLSLTRNLKIDLRAYPNAQSNSFITSGLEVRRKVTFIDGTEASISLFRSDEAIQAIVLAQSESVSDSLLITSEVYEPKSISIAEYFDDLQASERINFILADTLKAVEKLFFQQGISTAGKRNQSIGQIPASVVIVSKEEIAAQGYQSVPEILENVTGLYLFRDYSWSGGDPIVGMRGFFSQGFNNDIIILVNGVNMYEEYWGFYPFSRFPIGVEAIDRIEIVRGPMSVLYGSGAFFGAINIITNAPLESDVADDQTFPKFLATSYGSQNTRRLSGGLKYKKDRVSFAFNANVNATDGLDEPFERFLQEGLQTSFRTTEMLSREQRYVSASLNLQDKAGLTQYSIDLTASSENRGVFESTVASSNAFCQCPIPLANPNAPGVLNRSNSAYGGIRVTHSPKSSDLNLNLAMFFHEYRTNIDYDAGGNRIGQSSFLSKAFETEFSVSRSVNRLSGIVGLNARIANDLFTTFDTPNSTLSDGNNFRRLEENQNLSFVSVFGEFAYQIVPEKLSLTSGIRLEKLNEFNFLKNPTLDSTQQQNLAFEPAESETIVEPAVVIPRAALVYNINPNNFLKLLYGEARKRPSFGNFTDTTSLEFPRIRTLEFNFIREGKIDQDRKIRTQLNASIYYNEIKDLISRISTTREGESIFVSSNARNVQTIGGEIGFLVQVPKKWSVEISGSYNRSDEEQTLIDLPGENNDLIIADQTASFSPELLTYVKGTYRWQFNPLDVQVGINSRLISSINSEFTLTGDTTLVAGELIPTTRRLGQSVPQYIVTNLNLRLSPSSMMFSKPGNKLGDLYLAISVTNLFDVEIQYPTTGNNETWARQGSPGFGRRLFVTLGIDI